MTWCAWPAVPPERCRPVDQSATPETYGEGKVAGELSILQDRGTEGAMIARAGLIGGPEGPFDRCGSLSSHLATARLVAVHQGPLVARHRSG